jgi:hypothetical protein
MAAEQLPSVWISSRGQDQEVSGDAQQAPGGKRKNAIASHYAWYKVPARSARLIVFSSTDPRLAI